jgi:hypothetical protein
MKLTKLDVAERQIVAAVQLLFEGGDPIPTGGGRRRTTCPLPLGRTTKFLILRRNAEFGSTAVSTCRAIIVNAAARERTAIPSY